MENNNLTLFFEFLGMEHLCKDVLLVPYYLGKTLGYEVTIVYPDRGINAGLPTEYRGVNLVTIKLLGNERSKGIYRNFNFYRYIWKNAKKIGIYMRFFHIPLSEHSALLYKLRNPKGKVYVKMDVEPLNITNAKHLSMIERLRAAAFIKALDCISCETSWAYGNLKNSNCKKYIYGSKLVLMQNGFDEEFLQSCHLVERTFAEKENLIITVGRLGTHQKNTELILDALSSVDLKNWKILLIGPIEESLRPMINQFYNNHPEFRDQVVFTGPINDKQELWEYYNKSKVFVLSSRWESSGLVYYEAKRFRNYILSTHVGAVDDVIENGEYGELFNGCSDLAVRLQSIIDLRVDISDRYSNFNPTSISWENCVNLLVDRLR